MAAWRLLRISMQANSISRCGENNAAAAAAESGVAASKYQSL